MRERVQAQVALAAAGAVLVCLGTLASRNPWLAAGSMAVVAFCVLFAGVVSSVLAGASTSLLLAFILPVSLASPTSTIPDRLLGWGMASAAAIAAIVVLWPAPARGPLRAPAVAACRALAARLRSEVAYVLGGEGSPSADAHDEVVAAADAAVGALHGGFLATPYRPTGLSTPARTIVRLVDELNWLNAILQARLLPGAGTVGRSTCAVKSAAAQALDRGADLLEMPRGDPEPLRAALVGAAARPRHDGAQRDHAAARDRIARRPSRAAASS